MLWEEVIFDLQRFAAIIMGGSDNALVEGTDGPDQISYSGQNVTIMAGDANDKIESSGQKCSIDAGAGNDNITNEGDSTTIDAGDGRDNIINYGQECSLNGGAGSDTISNTADLVTIIGGSDDDSIMSDGQKALILAGAGNDYIFNDVYNGGSVGSKVTIDAGAGNDYIQTYDEGDKVSINGGKGEDTILNGSADYGAGKSATLIGGKGDDLIINYSGENALFKYFEGDGNDSIVGFNNSSTLKIGNGNATYSKETLESDLVVTVGDGKITLVGAADLDIVNIIGTEINENSWELKGTTATYGSASETLITVNGVKSLEGISLKGKVVTVAASSLNATKVKISGDGYTLALADDVAKSSTKKAKWILDGTTAIYKSSYKTEGYTLASNGKSISYTAATTSTDLATVKGVKKTSGLSVSGKKITLKDSALGNKVTVDGKNYEFDFASSYKTATISGSSNADIITTHGSKLSISGGAGNDTIKVLGSSTSVTGGDGDDTFIFDASGQNVITDYKTGDKISISSGTALLTTSDNDVIVSVGFNKILTITGGKSETITYFDDKGEQTFSNTDDIKFNNNNTAATLLASYNEDTFDFASNTKLNTINASAVQHGLKITGNKNTNRIIGSSQDDYIDGKGSADTILGGDGNDTIIGGKGNDSLKGGKGSDVFVYNEGDGNDVITDYKEGEDRIKITSGTIKVKTSGKNVIFTVGTGKISVKGASEKIIAYTDPEGNDNYYLKAVTLDGKDDTLGATLASNYSKDSFDSADHDNAVRVIDASKVSKALTIKGSSKADKIYGGDGDDMIIGGRGGDSLQGNSGKDTFVYSSGDGKDVILDYEEGDKIKIESGTIKSITTHGNDVIFKIGSGSITVKNGKGTDITYINASGKTKVRKATTAKLDDSYWFTKDDSDFNTARLDSIVKTTSAAYSFGELDTSTPLTSDKTLIAYSVKK